MVKICTPLLSFGEYFIQQLLRLRTRLVNSGVEKGARGRGIDGIMLSLLSGVNTCVEGGSTKVFSVYVRAGCCF